MLSGTTEEIAEAILSMSYYEPDRTWVFDRLAAVASRPETELRRLVATCVGHIARIDREIDLSKAGALLDQLGRDAEVAGRVADAWEDIEMFASGRRKE